MTFRKLAKFREIPVCWQLQKHRRGPQDFISVLTHTVRCVNRKPVSKIILVAPLQIADIRGENKIATACSFF